MTDEESEAVIETTMAIRATLDKISGSLERIDKAGGSYGRRTRHIVIALILSLIVDLALTVTIGFVASSSAATSAVVQADVTAIHDVQVSTCNQSNQERLEQVKLWHEFIAIATQPDPTRPAPTPAQKAQSEKIVRQLLGYVDNSFAPVHCPKQ